jgi:hypothetical protein
MVFIFETGALSAQAIGAAMAACEAGSVRG